jgi:hypothetical protein
MQETMNDSPISESGQQGADSTPTSACQCAKDGLANCTAYLRENPWVGVAGGIVLGALVASLAKPAKPEPTALESLRQMLEDALEKLPTQKEAGAAVCKVLKKFHVPV